MSVRLPHLSAVALVLATGLAATASDAAADPGDPVPVLVGLTPDDATNAVAAWDDSAWVQITNEVPAGVVGEPLVAQQSESPDDLYGITVLITLGVQVPDLLGLAPDEVPAALAGTGLGPLTTADPDDLEAQAVVVEQAPAPNDLVPYGTPVTVLAAAVAAFVVTVPPTLLPTVLPTAPTATAVPSPTGSVAAPSADPSTPPVPDESDRLQDTGRRDDPGEPLDRDGDGDPDPLVTADPATGPVDAAPAADPLVDLVSAGRPPVPRLGWFVLLGAAAMLAVGAGASRLVRRRARAWARVSVRLVPDSSAPAVRAVGAEAPELSVRIVPEVFEWAVEPVEVSS